MTLICAHCGRPIRRGERVGTAPCGATMHARCAEALELERRAHEASIKGGQGRSDGEVYEEGINALIILAIGVFVVLFIWVLKGGLI